MKPTLGQARISIELWNQGAEPQQYRFDPRLAATALEVTESRGTTLTPIMRHLPCQVALDEKGKVTERTLAPGDKVTLTQELNLGLAYYLEQPGKYQIRFGGLAKKLSLSSEGHGYPQSNSLTLDIAEGPRPEIHQIWKLFQGVSFLPDKTPASSDLFNDQTVRIWLRERTNCPYCLVTFQESRDPPLYPFLSQEELVPPYKIHDVLLGKTKLGFAHLQVRELFDTTWTKCEVQIRERLGEKLQPVVHATPPRPLLISGFGRSAVGLLQGEKLLIAFYTRGKLAFDPQTVTDKFDAKEAWKLTLHQTTEEPKTHEYRLEYRENRPNEMLVNGRAMPLGLEKKWAEETSRTHGIWCGLTSYGRCQSTERWHEWFEALANDAAKSELNHERQFSWAWYLDNDLWEFESYRTTLEMEDLTNNVVIAWDEQHPIQHSDAARAAKLRVLADGRVFASKNGRETAQQLQLTPAELSSLIEKLLPLFGDPLPPLKPGEVRVDHWGGHWDAEQESMVLSHAGKTCRVLTQSASRSDKQNPLGIEPLNASEIRSLLGGLVQKAYAGGQANLDRCAESPISAR